MDLSLTPPSSPNDLSSRLLTKRRCPFGESPHQEPKIAATCDNMGRLTPVRGLQSLYDSQTINTGFSAFQIMMSNQRANSNALPSASAHIITTTSYGKCWVCQHDAETLPCTFCEHGACEMCVRQCSKCCGVFCSFCSTINYDHHEDSALCLTCNAEEFRKMKSKNMATQSQWGQSIGQERFPQLMA